MTLIETFIGKEEELIMEIRHLEERKKDLLAAFLLIVFAFVVNRGIAIKGLFMDDLYLWSCYGEQSFFQYVFPLGSTRFRFLYYLAAWLELAFIGPHIGWIVPINILLNAAVAFTVYKMAQFYSRSDYISIFCGIAYLASRMAYYQIGQTYGLMETLALWLAIGILYLLSRCLSDHGSRRKPEFYLACVLYFAVCFVHERYMVLIPLFFFVLLFGRRRGICQWLAPIVTFALVQGIRVMTIGKLMPAGTGRTQVADTFSVKEAIRYAFSQVAYVFGINAGPEHLNGQNFREAPLLITLLIAVADLMLVAIAVAFLVKLIRDWRKCLDCLPVCILFLGFIAGCIACSSVTIRVEMRWVYVSYTAALLFLSWMYGVLTRDLDRKMALHVQALPFVVMITGYVVLMLPVELYYRSLYPNLYFWAEQQQYNSLAEVTYGTYGDDIFGKKIYIIGDSYDMSEFTDETFFKVFDPERMAEGTEVIHIADVRDIGLVDDDMLVLQEDPAHNRYLDITEPVRRMKCRGLYGYYSDGWIDEQAEVQLMTGEDGTIEMSFYYPGEITGDEWMTIYVNDDPKTYLQFTDQQMTWSWTGQPYRTVTLRFETNFYVRDAQEKRGERRLAAITHFRAD
jgi:hypothetical protein